MKIHSNNLLKMLKNHLYLRKRLSAGTVPVNKKHLTGTVLMNKQHLTGTLYIIWGNEGEMLIAIS